MLNFIFKGVVGVTVMMWVRWTLPRLRIDQVMTTCLKYCTPIAAVMFLGATLWQYCVARAARSSASPAAPATCAAREGWIDADATAAGEPRKAGGADDKPPSAPTLPSDRAARVDAVTDGEPLTMDAIYWPSFFFLLFAALACAFAVAVRAQPATSCGWRFIWCSRWPRRPACSSWPGPISSARCSC